PAAAASAAPEVTTSPPAAAPRSGEGAAVAQGLLTLSSRPRAQVIVDGEFVGWSPVLQHAASPGSHTITLVTDDGQRTTFRVTVAAGEEVRKVWLFDSKAWAE
ncbi:MAG: PEGA domain-containing protein, partial [Pseudomonadota bacterium]